MGKMYKNVLQLTLYKLFRKREYINVVVPAIQSSHTMNRPHSNPGMFFVFYFFIFLEEIKAQSKALLVYLAYSLNICYYFSIPSILHCFSSHYTAPAQHLV